MEYDLLFTIVADQNWKEITKEGIFAPASLQELGYIKCIDEKDLERYLNQDALEGKELMLVVIDPLRIKDSIKAEKNEGFNIVKISGSLTMDAIIDKIDLIRSKKGTYSINIKHYD